MSPYRLAFTLFRMAAVGLLLYLLYGWASYLFAPTPWLPQGANVSAILEAQQRGMVRTTLFTISSAAVLYFLAPVLARLVSIGSDE